MIARRFSVLKALTLKFLASRLFIFTPPTPAWRGWDPIFLRSRSRGYRRCACFRL